MSHFKIVLFCILLIVTLIYIGEYTTCYKYQQFTSNYPMLQQDPYVSCNMIKNMDGCNTNKYIYNFGGLLSKCQWMNTYCGPIAI